MDWSLLFMNTNAIHLLEKNKYKIDWDRLSENANEIELLEKNPDKIFYDDLSFNSSIFELDYNALKERCAIYKEELIRIALHPKRIIKYLEQRFDLDDLENII